MDCLANILRRNLHRGYPCLDLYLILELVQLVLAYKLIMNGVVTVENSKSSVFSVLCRH
jgi:hypothetical protein